LLNNLREKRIFSTQTACFGIENTIFCCLFEKICKKILIVHLKDISLRHLCVNKYKSIINKFFKLTNMKKIKLLLATCALMGGVFSSNATDWTDVTSWYISNPNFEGTVAVTSEYKTYHKDVTDGMVSGLIAINGWIPVYGTNDTRAGGVVGYNSGIKVSGLTAPTLNPEGGTSGYALGLAAVWSGSAQYLTDKVTLPAGEYKISVKYYNSSTNNKAVSKNLIGFLEEGGTERYGSTKTFTKDSWTTESVTFTLESAVNGQFSVGYTMGNNGNNDVPHLFFDNFKVEYDGSGHSAPSLSLRADLGDDISLTNFVPAASNFTLEVEGTAATPITIAGAGITYTPTTTGTVRFAKGTGSVYVYEGVEFKGVIAAGTPAFTTNIFTDANAKGSDNILSNGSFETLGDKLADGKFKLGSPWTSNREATSSGIRIGTSSDTHRLVWRGKGDSKYFGQPVTGLKPNRTYQVTVCQVDQGNGWADFNVGIGASAGGVELASSKFTLGRKGSDGDNQYAYKGVWYTTFTTPSSIVEANTYYFTFANTSTGSHDDALTQIDWIALAEMEDLPITGVSSAKYTSDGAFRPATPKDAYDDALAIAIAARDNSDYNVVTGSERTTLVGYINADEPATTDGYNTATTNLQNATNALIDATAHYQALIDAQEAVPDLAYASTAASAFITAVATSADDADAKLAAMTTNIRAYYESHAMAEGNATTVNYTHVIANPDAMNANNGWTWSGPKNDPKNAEPWTDASGNSSHWYFDGGNWNASSWTTTMSQDITLPAGTYLLTAKGRAATNTTLTMTACGENVALPHVSSTGNVFNNGWGDASLEFTSDGSDVTITVTATTSTIHEWFSVCDFRLVRLDATLATSDDYDDLNDAIDAAEAKTLGFEDDEYAPYANAGVLAKLIEAKAVNQSINNEQSDVQALTTYLNTSSNWTANDGDVDIIYNGTFAVTGIGYNPQGWTRSNNGWGQQITSLTAAANDVDTETTTAWYYNNNGAWEYGKDDVYKMPLTGSQTYKLTFKYRSHETNSNNSLKASVLNDSDEGLAEVTFAKNGDATKFVTATAYFTTGAAGNYVLSLTQNGNTHLTDVSIEKVASTALALDEDVTYVPENRTFYETVTLARTIKADKWSTFCVPFDMTEDEITSQLGAETEVKELTGVSENGGNYTLTFSDASSIEAGKPYMVKVPSNVSSISLSNKTIKADDTTTTEGDVTFTGTYTNGYAPMGSFIISNNAFYLVNTDSNSDGISEVALKAFRGYITVDSGSPVKALNFDLDDDATGISATLNDKGQMTNDNIYNVAGQKMSKLQKGINIVNGKKVLK
jgi:hypothetical protein